MRNRLSMEYLLCNVWGTIGSVALAILILLAMITVHEFGHYLAGKILHFKIDEFSIGFGPALFKRRSKKTGELFSLRLIPLGGYCAFAGEDGVEKASEESPEASRESKSEEPFSELASEEENHSDKKEQKEQKEQAEREEKTQASGYFTNRPCWQRIIVLVSGALMNYVLAIVVIIASMFSFGQSMIAVYRAEPTAEIAAQYCLQDYDILLSAEGKDLYLTTDLAHILNGKKAGDRVQMRISRVVGQDEAGKKVREEMQVSIVLRCDVSAQNSSDLDSVWSALGFAKDAQSGYQVAGALYKFGFWETLGRSFAYSFAIAGSIFSVLGELLTGKLGISALGGPVTTITMTSQIVATGMRGFLEISGFIGVNLAVFNLLPIPALDGSKVVFTAIEWIRGKPLNRKVEAIIHAVGFLLLLGFAVLVDVLQFL